MPTDCLSEPAEALRGRIVVALRETRTLRLAIASRGSSALPADLERAFSPLADAGAWNVAHPDYKISVLDLLA